MPDVPQIKCCCTGDGEQLSLMHVPVLVRPKRTPPPGVRYSAYRPKTHATCYDCVSEIHELGVARAPYPRPVRWRRTDAAGSIHLCEQHRDQRLEQEQP